MVLIIYDLTGFIWYQGMTDKRPEGLQHLTCEIPQHKRIVSINVLSEPHTPIFEDIPKSEMEILKERVLQLEANNEALLAGVGTVTKGE